LDTKKEAKTGEAQDNSLSDKKVVADKATREELIRVTSSEVPTKMSSLDKSAALNDQNAPETKGASVLLSKTVQVTETEKSPTLSVEKATLIKTATKPEAVIIVKPASDSVVKNEIDTVSSNKVALAKDDNKVAVSKAAVRSMLGEKQLDLKPADKTAVTKSSKAAVKNSTAERAVKLSKANEQKQIKKALSAKSKSASKAACGGYAYGGCYDLALKSDFKFRQALKIEAAPAVQVASVDKAASNQAESKLVQKVVSKETKKTLGLSKLDATKASKEFSRTTADK